MRRLGAALALAVSLSASAQVEVRAPQTTCTLPVDAAAPVEASASARRAVRGCPAAERTATFEVTYDGFPFDAERAFQAAVDTWACQIESSVPIRIAAAWEPLGAGTLGTAGPFVLRDFDGAPSRGVWYASALADRLAGRDVNPSDPDIEASFNSAFQDWNLDPATPADNRYDLYTVVLHEIGHGLGFIGAMRVEDGRGFVGEDPEGPYAYDLQTQDAAGAPLFNSVVYPDGSVRLGDALTEAVWFTGAAAEAAGESPVRLYAPNRWEPGGSYSHLDESTYPSGTPDGMMSPFVSRGEAVDTPGPATCSVLADIGWRLAGECAAQVGPLDAPSPRLDVALVGPNPVRSRTRVRVQSEVSRRVSVAVLDVLGRRVLDLGTASVIEGAPVEVEVDAGALASGPYFVVVVGGPDLTVVPVTVVRG